MTQQDYTAPELLVKVSRKERFQQVFEVMLADATNPDRSLAGVPFFCDLLDGSGVRLTQANCTRPADNVVLVELTTAQMSALRAGRYRLEVYSLLAGEREDLVTILMTVE